MTEQTALQIRKYMRSETMMSRFAETVGPSNAGPYITSVLLAVANNPALQDCTHESIATSALRAASLRLSVDPSTKQAYLVPFGRVCTLIVGYKGLQDMAVRTKEYRYINTAPMHQGAVITEDPITGFHTISEAGDKTAPVVGWLAAFGMMSGYAKTIYMTVEEIHAHAKKYSKGYNRADGAWKTDTQAMERKTVLRILLTKWGYMDPTDVALMEAAEEEQDTAIAAEFNEVTDDETPEPRTETQLKAELGFSSNGNGKPADPADAFWKAVKAVGLDKATGKDILKGADGDFAEALRVIETQYTPPVEEAVPA